MEGTFNGSTRYHAQIVGLDVISRGVISVNGLTAEDNTSDGIYLTNTADISGTKGITVGKTRVFSNGGVGLRAVSYGMITVNTIDAAGKHWKWAAPQ